MKRIAEYGLLAIGTLVTSVPGSAQTPRVRIPQATVRQLATLEGRVRTFLRLPNGYVLLYTVGDTSYAYNILTKRRIALGTDLSLQQVSPQGDRFAFRRLSDSKDRNLLWTMRLDPNTGATTGEAQRVSSLGVGRRSTFSPDGTRLVYAVGPRSDSTWDVTVGSATGGTEHVVANYPYEVYPFWSADSKWVYIERYGTGRVPNRHEACIERVPAVGGPTEILFPVHPALRNWFENVVGISPDGRVALYMRNPDQFFYMTSSGATGEITVPLPPLDDGFGIDNTLASTRYATMTQASDQSVHVLDLSTGQVRSLFAPQVRSITPTWSPDGRRLAVRTGNVSNYAITVMNADGSGQHRFPVSPALREHQDWGSAMRWSPDGRFLAFKADAWQKLALLDVRSGHIRILTTSPGEGIGEFVWRSDGSAILASRLRERMPPWGLSIFAVRLDGTQRLLHDLSAELPWARGAHVASEGVALAGDGTTRIASMPIEGGAARDVPIPIAYSAARMAYSGNSPDGRWIFGEITEGSPRTHLLVMSTAGDSTRIVTLPFESAHRGVAILPDGQHVVVAGRALGDASLRIFVVPLDGGVPREFGGIPGHEFSGQIALSPDGRLVAFTTSENRYTSTIIEVDFGPSLGAIKKH